MMSNPYYEMGQDAYYEKKDIREALAELDREEAEAFLRGYMRSYEDD